jgi:hypothetical protein
MALPILVSLTRKTLFAHIGSRTDWTQTIFAAKEKERTEQTMPDYIEREALLKVMHGLHSVPLFMRHRTEEDFMFERMVGAVQEFPADDVVEVINRLKTENKKLKKELTILRNYIHHNNLECDVMGYYGCGDESEVTE